MWLWLCIHLDWLFVLVKVFHSLIQEPEPSLTLGTWSLPDNEGGKQVTKLSSRCHKNTENAYLDHWSQTLSSHFLLGWVLGSYPRIILSSPGTGGTFFSQSHFPSPSPVPVELATPQFELAQSWLPHNWILSSNLENSYPKRFSN